MTITDATEVAMAMEDALEEAAVNVAQEQLRTRIRDAAIDQIGRTGFKTPLRTIADAAGVSLDVLLDYFESKRNLVKVCDDHIIDTISSSKPDALQPMSPDAWFGELAVVERYAPLLSYLVRSMQDGARLARMLMTQMIDNAVGYLEDGVRAGTIKPSRDTKARATFLALNNAGSFLLYRRIHPTPNDMAAVLHDYSRDMLAPALEIYTDGLLASSPVIDGFEVQARSFAF